ncbi:MAG: SDR family oxidoreductase [Caulobacterales bacterium]
MARDHRKIVVTGATGGLGSSVVQQLLRITPALELGVSVRQPEAAQPLAALGVRVRHGDFDKPKTLDEAFDGAERLLVISTKTVNNHARFVQHRNAIDAARRGGVRHIYYTSIVQRAGSVFDLAPGHLDTEACLAESGLAHTILRNGHFIENLPMFLGPSIIKGELTLPPDGLTAWVARADLAEGIARLMLTGGHEGETLLLTGPEGLDFRAIAALASAIVGRRITRTVVDPGAYLDMLVARGTPKPIARSLVSGFASRANGELAKVDPTLQELVGRPLRTVAEALPALLAAAAPA